MRLDARTTTRQSKNGGYDLFNNMWNSSATLGPQTLYACSFDNWYVVSNQTDQGGAGLTYPSVQMSLGHPLRSYTTIVSTFAATSPHVGIYEDAYDIWLNGYGAGHTEILVWTESFYQVPGGTLVTMATFGGHTYDVWRTSDGSYVAFVATEDFTSGTVDLLKIIDWVVTEEWLAADATLTQIDYGVEIVSTGGADATFQFTDFSITAE
jgi:Glycosyl hydrolase family 12